MGNPRLDLIKATEQSIGSLGLDYYGSIVLVAVIAMQDDAIARSTLVDVLQHNWGNKAQQKSLKSRTEGRCKAEIRSRIRHHSKKKQYTKYCIFL